VLVHSGERGLLALGEVVEVVAGGAARVVDAAVIEGAAAIDGGAR